ncbi:signal recognition particle binding protein [Earliella scabrosa]|nr:signal recognition particle binding protein [Earliella scabrosa]
MLDHCSISHKGGLVLWSRSFTPAASHTAASSTSPVNSLVREALIEGRSSDGKYEKDGYAVKWTFVNDLELIFVVAYQRILQLTYVDELLLALKTLFIKLFQPILTTFVASLHVTSTAKLSSSADPSMSWSFQKAFEGWDAVFDKLLRGLEDKAAQERRTRVSHSARAVDVTPPAEDPDTAPSHSNAEVQDEEQIARNVQALKNRLRGRGGTPGRRGRGRTDVGSGRESLPGSDSETTSISKRKSKAKAQRKWGDSAPTESDMASLDYSYDSAASEGPGSTLDLSALVDSGSLGTRTQDGLYEVKDWEFSSQGDKSADDVIAEVLKKGNQDAKPASGSLGALGSIFARLTGSKVLTEDDLKPVLEAMKQHLMKKNVAKEIADKVCEDVGQSLVGKKVGGFQTTTSAVRQALANSITRILTPKTSTDLLLSIRTKLSTTTAASQQKMPYSITFVGVNGVGKSTNLSKVCFWLIQNGFRVLIAACDTFRSGAVEQLRVHVRNLGMLGVDGATNSKGRVELYERGYGKDAAGIAKEAIAYARDNEFDVVLIDTAGRMQDNEPLMRALAKLVATNNPDKILFVGEALVGNEAVDQLTKFDRALRDFSASSGGQERGIDGMLVTKWDTVDDKVGAALSMTYVTGQPIIFVGCGQTYTDLRQLRVANVVQAILSD